MSHVVRARRSHDGQFTILAHHAVRNPRLSRMARGMLWELLSHDESFQLSYSGLEHAATDGQGRITTAVKELKAQGYLRIDFIRKQGRMSGSVWNVTDNPETHPLTDIPPYMDFPLTVKPCTVDPALRRNNGKKNQEQPSFELKSEQPPDPRDEQFGRLWKLDPRGSRQDARVAFRAAVPKRVTFEVIYAARQAAISAADEMHFVKMLESWTKKERWNDRIEPRRNGEADAYDPVAEVKRIQDGTYD